MLPLLPPLVRSAKLIRGLTLQTMIVMAYMIFMMTETILFLCLRVYTIAAIRFGLITVMQLANWRIFMVWKFLR